MDEQALTELLECSVCLEQLDHTSKVLPCQHTFCRRCLDEIVSTKQELRCPECRFLVEIRVEDLPTNILLVRLLEGLKTRSGAPPRGRDAQASQGANSSHVAAFAQQQQQRQGNGGGRPCAKALFNYDAKDPGDLTFKKGDLIYLRKQVDENWYHGETNDQHGFFPVNYVQVVTPLPTTIPQCKGLYDFDMEENKEGDCLSFKKNEVVTVIRRVDDNWLEGKKGEKIGIFPIAFVEMNDPAKVLLSITNSLPGTSESGSSTSAVSGSEEEGKGSPGRVVPPVLPVQIKRHSYTSTSSSQPLPSPSSLLQRRSLEVTSNTNLMGTGGIPTPPKKAPAVPQESPTRQAVPKMGTGTVGSAEASSTTTNSRDTSPASSAITTPMYVALYKYKSQKEDEVELKKGEYYSVAEKCQDGWFKGQCLKSGLSGVFPGNYVQLVRANSAFKPVGKSSSGKSRSHSSGHSTGHMIPSTSSSPSLSNCVPIPPRPKMSPGRAESVDRDSAPPVVPRSSKRTSTSPMHAGLVVSPPVPSVASSSGSSRSSSKQNSPRLPHSSKASKSKSPALPSSSSSSSSVTSSPHSSNCISPGVASGSNNQKDIRTSSPLVQASGDKMAPSVNVNVMGAMAPKSGSSVSPVWKHSMSASTNITPPNVVVGATGKLTPIPTPAGAAAISTSTTSSPLSSSSSSPSTGRKEKRDRRDKEKLSLVKRLTTGKSKKSKSGSVTDQDSASLSDSSISHTRSGSYPSEVMFSESHHKKTGSFDSSVSAGQPKPSRPKPLSREKYLCTESYPPQSEIELDLKIGDIIYVHKKRDDGWFKGTLQRSGKTGLFPGSFVQKYV